MKWRKVTVVMNDYRYAC